MKRYQMPYGTLPAIHEEGEWVLYEDAMPEIERLREDLMRSMECESSLQRRFADIEADRERLRAEVEDLWDRIERMQDAADREEVQP